MESRNSLKRVFYLSPSALGERAVRLAHEDGALDSDQVCVRKLEHGEPGGQHLGLGLGVEAGPEVGDDVGVGGTPQVVGQVVIGVLNIPTASSCSGYFEQLAFNPKNFPPFPPTINLQTVPTNVFVQNQGFVITHFTHKALHPAIFESFSI